MPHVQFAAGVGEHGQAVIFFARGVFDGAETLLLLPVLLGPLFDGLGLVKLFHRVGFCRVDESAGF
jgi:hypothetical protein